MIVLSDFVADAKAGDQFAALLPCLAWCAVLSEYRSGDHRGLTCHVVSGHWDFELDLRPVSIRHLQGTSREFGVLHVEIVAWRSDLVIQAFAPPEFPTKSECRLCGIRHEDEKSGLELLRREARR